MQYRQYDDDVSSPSVPELQVRPTFAFDPRFCSAFTHIGHDDQQSNSQYSEDSMHTWQQIGVPSLIIYQPSCHLSNESHADCKQGDW